MKAMHFKKCFLFFSLSVFSILTSFSQEGKINVQQNASIESLMALNSEMVQNNSFGTRYKIQIFYGNSSEATDVLEEFKKNHPEWATTIEYQPPNYKVWVGDFRNRLEADRAFMEIEADYRSAFIFKPNAN